jgi:excisionase family DNA binding protein
MATDVMESHSAPITLLTLDQVAQSLAISKATVRRLVDTGELPTVRIGPGGRLVRVRVRDVEAVINESDAPAGL